MLDQGGIMGWGFCRYDITTADIDNLEKIIMCDLKLD